MSSTNARIEIRPPQRFNTLAVLVISAYGLLLAIPALLAMMVVSVLHFSWLTFLVPLLTIAVLTFFLPFGFGNPHVARLVRRQSAESKSDPQGFIVQLTTVPRLRTGLGALAEDADDVGWLTFTDSELLFRGDAVSLSVPFDRIQELRKRNGGWRVLFLYGPWIEFSVGGLTEHERFRFAERSSWFLPTARRTGNRMYERLAQAVRTASSSS